jgi:hypothetical protein
MGIALLLFYFYISGFEVSRSVIAVQREFRVRCVFFKPLQEINGDCNHKSWHLKGSTQKPFYRCDAILETGPVAPQ